MCVLKRAENKPVVRWEPEFLRTACCNSTAMTTAVQPSELVFEFASNGMDEINQVNTTPLLSLNT